MKLHLPCALRGALLACFAVACTTPAWAGDLVKDEANLTASFSGELTDSTLTINSPNYTLKADADGNSGTLGNINVKLDTTLTISGFTDLTLSSIKVEEGKTLTLIVDTNTTLRLTDINLPSGTKVNYTLGDGATIYVSANDCRHGSISGNGTVLFTGGVIDGSKAGEPASIYFTMNPGDFTFYQDTDFAQWTEAYSTSGSTITYGIANQDVTGLRLNGSTGGGYFEYNSQYKSFQLNWDGKHTTIKPDGEASLYDPDSVGRVTENGQNYWHLNKDVSYQDMEDAGGDGMLPDHSDTANGNPDVKLAPGDLIRFAGGTLTSSKDIVISNRIVRALDDKNKEFMVKLAPAEDTTMTIVYGDDVLMTGGVTKNDNGTPDNTYDDSWTPDTTQGLELSGGEGSMVILQNVTIAEPTNIHFTTDNTILGFTGDGTLTLDASKNTFRATSILGKEAGTLIYKAKANDSIGALVNLQGTIEIDKAATSGLHTLTAGTLYADTLKVSKMALAINAEQIIVNDLSTVAGNDAATGCKVTVDELEAKGQVTLNGFTTLDAKSMVANKVYVDSQATLTGALLQANTVTIKGDYKPYPDWPNVTVKGGKLEVSGASGTTTITGMPSDNATFNTATITGMVLDYKSLAQSTLSAAGVQNALITSSRENAIWSLGTVSDSKMEVTKKTQVENTVFTNSELIVANKSVLSNTKIDGTSSLVIKADNGYDGAATFENFNFTAGSIVNIGQYDTPWLGEGTTADGTLYEATNNVSATNGIGITGSVLRDMDPNTLAINKQEMTVTGISFEQDIEQEMTDVILVQSSNGGVIKKGDTYTEALYTAPGWVGSLDIVDNKVVYSQTNKTEDILASLMSSQNVRSVVPVLRESAESGADGVIEELYDYIRDSSRATQENRQKALDALASGSITMLADSQRQGVTHTMSKLRNRVIQMGNPQGYEPETNIHAWIEADGSYSDIDQDGGCAGYEYSTWGGTVGVHADMGDLSFGAAISAAYGDLTSHADDRAEGDHDSQSVSLFARHQKGNWIQMGILSFGRNDIEMERSINASKHYGESKVYNAESDVSGYTITAYYEAGYTIALNEEGSHVIQPLASLMLTSAHLGGFTESGSIGNAGFCSDSQDNFYGTLGIGARYQVVLGTNVDNRVSFLELRAKVVQDFGDETNEASVRFAGAPGQTFTQCGADVGRTGFQFGAGVSVPFGMYKTLFADVDADIRSGATSVSGSVGMRVEF